MSIAGRGGSRKKSTSGWKAGDRVWAYWDNDDCWYSATITSVDGDTINVRYDGYDSDDESDETSVDVLDLGVDDDVDVWSDDDEDYYPATVTAIEGDKIQVKYDDGGSKEWTTIDYLRCVGYFSSGDEIWAYWEDDEYWYPAVVSYVDDDGTYVVYDGDDEDDEDNEYRLDDDCISDLYVEVGDKVEGWWDADSKYYPATVLEINGDKIQIQHKDGTQWTDIYNLRMADE